MISSLCRQFDTYHRQMVWAAFGITWPEAISTAKLTKWAKLTNLSHTICKRRLHLVEHVITVQLWCQAPLSMLLTTVPLNYHTRQDHGQYVALQHNVANDLRSMNRDVSSIAWMTMLCFFNLVDTLD